MPAKGQFQPIADRFWSRVDTSGECWLWTGGRNRQGYGLFTLTDRRSTTTAHRMAWILTHGALGRNDYVCHDCPGGDNPLCVRPAHMYVGSPSDNMRDRYAKRSLPSIANLTEARRATQRYRTVVWNGKIFRFNREASGLSQLRLAALLGVSGPLIARWEKGCDKPSERHWPALERAIGLTPDQIRAATFRQPEAIAS